MLFVCQECNCIDSTLYTIPGLDKDKINMTLQDMLGETNKTFNILNLTNYQKELCSGDVNRTIDPLHPRHNDIDIEDFELQELKYPEQVLMLCSECNAGNWHNQFEKLEAVEDIIKVANTSLYRSVGEDRDLDMVLNYIKENRKDE